MVTPMGSTASSSAGLAAYTFANGVGNLSTPGLGFSWDIFGDVLEQGLEAAKPLINAGAQKISRGSVLPYDPNQWGRGGVVPGGAGVVGGQVAVGTNLSTGTLVGLGLGALVLVMMLTRR